VRAGLLSQPEVIEKLNERFVSTTLTYFDLAPLAKKGNGLAREVVANWANPVSLMFFTPQGRFVTKLTQLRELTAIHPDTDLRPGQRHDPSPEGNVRAFLEHVERHFGGGVKAP
jgi:hypothetical protein